MNMSELGDFPEPPPAKEQLPEPNFTDEEIQQAASAIRKLRLLRGN
jgi:hypothetical protein